MIILSTILLRRYQGKIVAKIDEDNISPPDFGIYVRNLPLDKNEEEVKEFF
jgi:RNA recognition motif-containing protein